MTGETVEAINQGLDASAQKLIAVAAGWSEQEFSSFLKRGVSLLQEYEATEIGSEQRGVVAVGIERALPPLMFQSRVEPRRTVGLAWRVLQSQLPVAFKTALSALLRPSRRAVALADIEMLLSLLGEASVLVSDDTAFLIQDRLEKLHEGQAGGQAAALLVTVLSGDGRAAISLLERLKRAGMLTLPVFYSAMRKVARWDPARLSILLQLLGIDLLEGERDEETLRFLIYDLIERAGAFTVLNAICDVDPRRCPSLFRSAFVGADAPYALRLVITRSRLTERTHIAYGAEVFPISLLDTPARDENWVLKLRSASGVRPQIEMSYAESEVPDTAQDAESTILFTDEAKARARLPVREKELAQGPLSAIAARTFGILAWGSR